ncbi:MAG: hypothetical protein AB1630_09260 [bacterium]
MLEFARLYLHHSFEQEAIMRMSKAIDFVKKGLCVATKSFFTKQRGIGRKVLKAFILIDNIKFFAIK